MDTNVLYYGDNLEVMPRYIDDNSIDLIYIDPPFFSSKAYEIIYGDAKEKRMVEDRWKGDVYYFVSWMEPRLAQMYRVLRHTGSIYVHLDWHAVHYIKQAMDRIFGQDNFLNEIIWHYKRYTAASNQFQRLHDTILFYGKTQDNKFNVMYDEYGDKSGKRDSHYKLDEGGRWFRWQKRKGREAYKVYLSEKGVRLGDVWNIPLINASAKERRGYPTQKPERLLQRIIKASSSPNDIVADFFCGCGTTLAVAQQLGRRWIGCDVSPTALRVVKDRLVQYGATNIKEVGVPKNLDELQSMKPFEFQNYVVSFIQGVHNPKLTGESGVDGWTVIKHNPIQIKQQEHVGRPEIQKFESAIRKEKKDLGYIFAFSFSKPAYEEVARCKLEDNINIELVDVMSLMAMESPPSFL
jgi:DNA modification methylase